MPSRHDAVVITREVRARVGSLRKQLEVAHASVVVAVAALRYQRVDRDVEIARVLERCAGDGLHESMRHAAELATWLESSARRRRPHARDDDA